MSEGKSADLMAALEQCPLPVTLFISALELEVLHLHKKIAKLEVKNVTAHQQIDALKKELQEISERLHEEASDTICRH